MRNWRYSYKTSDGIRHEGTLPAPGRDAAFEELRRQGIRPIRVDEVPPAQRRAWPWVAAVLAAALAAAGGAWWLFGGRGAPAMPAPAAGDLPAPGGRCDAYQEIVGEVEAVREAYREASAKVDRELLANYALVERVRDMSEFRSVIAYGRESVSNAREAVRGVFSERYGDIPEAFPQDMADAQLLYGLVMEELDADEERLDSDDCALELLDANRGRWRVVKGAVKWSDPGLERQFRLFGREPVPGKTRWERDFGRRPRTIESLPVQLKAE